MLIILLIRVLNGCYCFLQILPKNTDFLKVIDRGILYTNAQSEAIQRTVFLERHVTWNLTSVSRSRGDPAGPSSSIRRWEASSLFLLLKILRVPIAVVHSLVCLNLVLMKSKRVDLYQGGGGSLLIQQAHFPHLWFGNWAPENFHSLVRGII